MLKLDTQVSVTSQQDPCCLIPLHDVLTSKQLDVSTSLDVLSEHFMRLSSMWIFDSSILCFVISVQFATTKHCTIMLTKHCCCRCEVCWVLTRGRYCLHTNMCKLCKQEVYTDAVQCRHIDRLRTEPPATPETILASCSSRALECSHMLVLLIRNTEWLTPQ